jgi:hypothetical protein
VGVGHAAAAGMDQAQQGPFTTLNSMLAAHAAYTILPENEREFFFRTCAGYKPTPAEMLKDGPGDITVLGQEIQAALRVATAIMATLYYGPNEELGVAHFHSAFDGDTLSLARTALADTPPSDCVTFRLHVELLALCWRIFRHVQQRCGGMRVTILFSRKASARDGPRFFCSSTYNASLPSLLRRKRTTSRGSIRPHGATSSRS